MSLLYPLSKKKLISTISVVAIAFLLAASLSQTVESAGNLMRSSTQTKKQGVIKSQEEQAAKSQRFPNLDVRTTEPKMMSAIAAANAFSITQRLQTRKISV